MADVAMAASPKSGATTPLASDLSSRPAEPAPTNEKIAIRKLNFYYENGNHALKDISASIYEHNVTAFIGPSGCGKSTLLRVFNRIYDIYHGQRAEGEVLLDGENIILAGKRDLGLLRARVGMVFQQPAPFPMSVYENIAFGIRLNRTLSRPELDVEVESALRRAALWNEVKDRLSGRGLDLSGGQQQRLCIARAIAVRPDVLLLDEPCSAIDPVSSAKIEQTICEFKKDHTVVIVTHNLQQAARVSDVAGFMFLGELIEFGSVKKMFTAPSDPRTQRFITGRFG